MPRAYLFSPSSFIFSAFKVFSKLERSELRSLLSSGSSATVAGFFSPAEAFNRLCSSTSLLYSHIMKFTDSSLRPRLAGNRSSMVFRPFISSSKKLFSEISFSHSSISCSALIPELTIKSASEPMSVSLFSFLNVSTSDSTSASSSVINWIRSLMKLAVLRLIWFLSSIACLL